jgi:hypothetical protein
VIRLDSSGLGKVPGTYLGEEQIVLLDAVGFRLLQALAACATDASEEEGSSDARIFRDSSP